MSNILNFTPINSAVYSGWVRHRRFEPKHHQFRYPMYMLAIDLDELDLLDQQHRYFRCESFAPLSFYRKDYFGDPNSCLKKSAISEVSKLGGNGEAISKVIMVGQVRCFGIYFSPINLFFCYQYEQPIYLLAEVNNTPWKESCRYLIDLKNPLPTEKKMHVSPFMEMAMQYHWQIKPPTENLSVHIENHRSSRVVFDATLALKRSSFSRQAISATLRQWPLMTFSILRGIYWQALRLLLKKIPFVTHPQANKPL